MEDTLEKFLCNILNAVLLVVVIIAAIGALGVETTSLLAVLGAAGLAVGLALQGSLSNFAAGVLIVAFRPYKVGDVIEAGGVIGTVKEVQIFTTVIHTGDNKRIIVPNSQIMNGTIINYSANDNRRIDLVFGCGYGDDLDKVRAILEEIVAADERILTDPETTIAVNELAESSVNFVVRPWVQGRGLLGRVLRHHRTGQKALRRRGHQHTVPATRCAYISARKRGTGSGWLRTKAGQCPAFFMPVNHADRGPAFTGIRATGTR